MRGLCAHIQPSSSNSCSSMAMAFITVEADTCGFCNGKPTQLFYHCGCSFEVVGSNPCGPLSHEFEFSAKVSAPLVALITQQHNHQLPPLSKATQEQASIILGIRREKRKQQAVSMQQLQPQLPAPLQRAVSLAQEKGASSWLSARPVEEHGFALHKSAFRDALSLRYGWRPAKLPSSCVCNAPFDVEHALSCKRGGFVLVRHNELRDLTADLLQVVCNDVEIEPQLQPLSGEHLHHRTAIRDESARLDVKARGFWGGRFPTH